jgi:arylsulfatase A-like enzyme
MISTVDLMPTLLDLAEVEIPQGVQGQSYAGELTGQGGSKREFAYIEYDESYLGDRLRQLRNHDWALTFYANSDFGLLFDRSSDPDERYNLWDSPEHQSIKRDLLTELLRYTSRADDWLPPKKCHA